MPSPACTVNAASTTNGVDVASGATCTIDLTDKSADRWSLVIVGTDDSSSAPAITIDPVAKTASFVAPTTALGATVILASTINGGRDGSGAERPDYTTTFGVYVRTSGTSARVIAVNETFEGDSAHGHVAQVNAAIRAQASSALAPFSVTQILNNHGGGTSPTNQAPSAWSVSGVVTHGRFLRFDASMSVVCGLGPSTFRIELHMDGAQVGTAVDFGFTDNNKLTNIAFTVLVAAGVVAAGSHTFAIVLVNDAVSSTGCRASVIMTESQ